jgi:hypothetical protein
MKPACGNKPDAHLILLSAAASWPGSRHMAEPMPSEQPGVVYEPGRQALSLRGLLRAGRPACRSWGACPRPVRAGPDGWPQSLGAVLRRTLLRRSQPGRGHYWQP